jgi:arylsulfatase A-like enzyme
MFYEEGRDPYDPNNHSMDPAWNDEMFKWYFHEWMPGVTDTEYVNALYDAETRYMDEELKRVLAALESVKEETLVVFTADHGEILDEQLGFYDHHGLYEGDVHVPLIMYYPGTFKAGVRVPGFVQNVDFVPTFLELAGVPQHTMQPEGKSLLPLANGERDGNYEELFLSEATGQVKRAVMNEPLQVHPVVRARSAQSPMQELVRLAGRPDRTEQHRRAASRNRGGVERQARRVGGKALQETDAQWIRRDRGVAAHASALRSKGETPARARLRCICVRRVKRLTFPKPEELNAGHQEKPEAEANTDVDEKTGTHLHGNVDK